MCPRQGPLCRLHQMDTERRQVVWLQGEASGPPTRASWAGTAAPPSVGMTLNASLTAFQAPLATSTMGRIKASLSEGWRECQR